MLSLKRRQQPILILATAFLTLGSCIKQTLIITAAAQLLGAARRRPLATTKLAPPIWWRFPYRAAPLCSLVPLSRSESPSPSAPEWTWPAAMHITRAPHIVRPSDGHRPRQKSARHDHTHYRRVPTCFPLATTRVHPPVGTSSAPCGHLQAPDPVGWSPRLRQPA